MRGDGLEGDTEVEGDNANTAGDNTSTQPVPARRQARRLCVRNLPWVPQQLRSLPRTHPNRPPWPPCAALALGFWSSINKVPNAGASELVLERCLRVQAGLGSREGPTHPAPPLLDSLSSHLRSSVSE
eukprot:8601426-Pyramimonas_sp.AAC.1